MLQGILRGAAGVISMKARQLIANSSFAPDQLKALEKAFDRAWARIAPSVGSRPEAVRAAQLKLADNLLDLARHGNFDPLLLADTAVHLMLSRASRFRP
jgi:hypothetical protein